LIDGKAGIHDIPDVVHLWNTYSDLLWEPGRHKETCMAYAHEIQDIVRRRGITAFDNSLVDAIRVECRRRGNKNSTINRKLSLLGKLLRKHHRDGHLNRLPDLKKFPERNGRIRFLTRDEEQSIFSALDAIDRHYGNLARFLINTGARVGEATSMRWSDVDGTTATFWESKAHTPRSVPLSRAAIAFLRKSVHAGRSGHSMQYAMPISAMPGTAPALQPASRATRRSSRTYCAIPAHRGSRRPESTSSASRSSWGTRRWQ
jgi:integrase